MVHDFDLSYVRIPPGYQLGRVWGEFSNLTRLAWRGNQGLLIINGIDKNSRLNNLAVSELDLTDASFIVCKLRDKVLREDRGDEHPNLFILSNLVCLKSLSIKKNVTLLCHDGRYRKLLPQELIVKFVHRCLTLRWLCSDLSNENVAMLRQELPDVTFVSVTHDSRPRHYLEGIDPDSEWLVRSELFP